LYDEDKHGVRKSIEDEKFWQTLKEVNEKFDATLHWNGATGIWKYAGCPVKDDIHLLAAVIRDTSSNREWWRRYAKRVLCNRFIQKAIFITFVRVKAELIWNERIQR